MKNWYNKYNKKQDFLDICKSTFSNKKVNLPSGNLKVEFKNYFFGKPFLGTGLIIIDFIFLLLGSKIYMPFINLFFTTKIKKQYIDETGHLNIKTVYISKLKYKYYGIFNKYSINTKKSLNKKLNTCHHRITDTITGNQFINFCKTISVKDFDKTKTYIGLKQNHSHTEIIANYISHNMIKNACDFLASCSHIIIIYFDTTKNDWFVFEKQGILQKTYLKEKIKDGWNIGNINNNLYSNGNYFVIDLDIQIVGDSGVRRYLEASQNNMAKSGIKSMGNAQVLMHNLSKIIRTVIYPITDNMAFLKRKIRYFTNKYFTPNLANLVSKRDMPFSGACLESIIEALYSIIKDRNNKQFVKHFGENEEFCEYFLKYIVDYKQDETPIFCKTHLIDFQLFLTHFAKSGNANFFESWKVII